MRVLPFVATVVLFAAGVRAAEAQQSAQVSMRDGVKLSTKYWTPGGGQVPAVLVRGYSAGGLGGSASSFTNAGYAFVSQQCRGNGGDDGTRFFPDDNDGYDCIEWIVKQPWSNGKVAMWGGSYWGATQWRASVSQHPGLKAIVPGFIDADFWKAAYWGNGALHLKMTTQSGRAIPGGNYSLSEWKTRLSYLPLIDMDKKWRGSEHKLWNDYITHSSFDGYWKAISMRDSNRWAKVKIPVYCVAGWKDYYAGVCLENYQSVKATGLSPDVRVRIGDHGHSGAPNITDTLKFLNYHLKGQNTGIQNDPPIKIQVRHGGWRMENQWPIQGTSFTKFYLSSPDGSRVGALQTQAPGAEPVTKYDYDPADPVLTLGANGSHQSVSGLIAVGPVDQRPNEGRQDVLVYTSPAFTEDSEIIGPMEARIWASSSARDTDFTVKLLDVYPDGKALNITEGVVRARFRNDVWGAPSLITPGRIYEYRIELLPVSIVFRKDHKLRIHLSSSNWPLWDRNQNTGNPLGMDAQIQVANQTIYHDATHPSHLRVPIVSGGSTGSGVAPSITSSALVTASTGQAYSYDVDATGTPAPTYSLSTSPAGMSINSTTGLVTWTPSAAGSFNVTVVASNGVSPDAPQSFTITVSSATSSPTIVSTPVTSATAGQAYATDVNASGNPAPAYSLLAAPAGMTIDSTTGLVSWMPPAAGSFDVTVLATNGIAPDATQSFTITVTAAGGGLPAGWSNTDVGSVGIGGSATYSSSTFTVNASGADIWGTADSFHFVYRPLSGDGEITAHVTGLQNTHAWAKSGVMIRESLAPGSVHAMMVLTVANGTRFERRTATGSTSDDTGGSGVTAPAWVRLVRIGDIITGYESADGLNWTLVGSDTIVMGADVLIGLPVTSHDNGALNTSTLDNVGVVSYSDSDGDGMPDAGETLYGLDPGNPDQDGNGVPDGLDDWDGDGVINQDEIANGTDPGGVPPGPGPGGTPPPAHLGSDGCGLTGAEFALFFGILVMFRQPRRI